MDQRLSLALVFIPLAIGLILIDLILSVELTQSFVEVSDLDSTFNGFWLLVLSLYIHTS